MTQGDLYIRIAVWSQIASSLVFIAVLVYMWFRWFMPVVLAAQDRSNRQIAEAERHRDEVREALEALRAQIETAEHDAQLIRERAKGRAQHERQLVLKETSDAGERALADAGRELERARSSARHRLRDEMVERALQLAREIALQRVGPEVDARFVKRFTGSLEGALHG